MHKVIANTPEEQAKGLTGAPANASGIFNYMVPRKRPFKRTDRDLDVFADGKFVGSLTETTPAIMVPPATQVVEKPRFNKGGNTSLYGMLCR